MFISIVILPPPFIQPKLDIQTMCLERLGLQDDFVGSGVAAAGHTDCGQINNDNANSMMLIDILSLKYHLNL